MQLRIKGMVCNHCVEAVKAAFTEANIPGAIVSLGAASVDDNLIDNPKIEDLKQALRKRGFELITDTESKLMEQARLLIINHVRNEGCNVNLSECLQRHLGMDYSSISKIFSAREGRTIEKYAIAQRIEYAKELLSYGELNISEVADKAGYSSVAHLSRQFKAVTGLTPTQYLKTSMQRTPLNLV